MNVHEIQKCQREFDCDHGWDIQSLTPDEKLTHFERELVGALGELGELANAVKKIRLNYENGEPLEGLLHESMPHLQEEVIDVFIYLLRLADLSGTDIAESYKSKLEKNAERFKKYES